MHVFTALAQNKDYRLSGFRGVTCRPIA